MKQASLTEGPIFQRLIIFSLPMILGNLLQQIYNLVDTLIVGKWLGPESLAAVGSSYTFMTFITSIIIGLCMGSSHFFSVDAGAKDHQRLQMDFVLSFGFIFAVTIVVYLIIYPGMSWILCLMQIPAEIAGLTQDYLSVVLVGTVFIFLYNFFAFLLRAMGNSTLPLVFLALSALSNIILDIFFVVGLALGVKGAAWATVLAQALSGFGLMLYAFIKLSVLRLDQGRKYWNKKRLQEIVLNDLATGVQQSVMNFGILMIQGLVNSFGTAVMASFAAAVKIDTIAYMPAQEFGNAYSLFISQNYGARKPERIRRGTRLAFLTSMIFCGAVSFLIYHFAASLMTWFIDPSEQAIIAEGVRYLRIEGAMYMGIGILFLWYGYFRAVNQPQISLLLTIISLGTRVALSYALAPQPGIGVIAIWWSIPIGWILADLTGLWLYFKANKKMKEG